MCGCRIGPTTSSAHGSGITRREDGWDGAGWSGEETNFASSAQCTQVAQTPGGQRYQFNRRQKPMKPGLSATAKAVDLTGVRRAQAVSQRPVGTREPKKFLTARHGQRNYNETAVKGRRVENKFNIVLKVENPWSDPEFRGPKNFVGTLGVRQTLNPVGILALTSDFGSDLNFGAKNRKNAKEKAINSLVHAIALCSSLIHSGTRFENLSGLGIRPTNRLSSVLLASAAWSAGSGGGGQDQIRESSQVIRKKSDCKDLGPIDSTTSDPNLTQHRMRRAAQRVPSRAPSSFGSKSCSWRTEFSRRPTHRHSLLRVLGLCREPALRYSALGEDHPRVRSEYKCQGHGTAALGPGHVPAAPRPTAQPLNCLQTRCRPGGSISARNPPAFRASPMYAALVHPRPHNTTVSSSRTHASPSQAPRESELKERGPTVIFHGRQDGRTLSTPLPEHVDAGLRAEMGGRGFIFLSSRQTLVWVECNEEESGEAEDWAGDREEREECRRECEGGTGYELGEAVYPACVWNTSSRLGRRCEIPANPAQDVPKGARRRTRYDHQFLCSTAAENSGTAAASKRVSSSLGACSPQHECCCRPRPRRVRGAGEGRRAAPVRPAEGEEAPTPRDGKASSLWVVHGGELVVGTWRSKRASASLRAKLETSKVAGIHRVALQNLGESRGTRLRWRQATDFALRGVAQPAQQRRMRQTSLNAGRAQWVKQRPSSTLLLVGFMSGRCRRGAVDSREQHVVETQGWCGREASTSNVEALSIREKDPSCKESDAFAGVVRTWPDGGVASTSNVEVQGGRRLRIEFDGEMDGAAVGVGFGAMRWRIVTGGGA
ncbi:hypothetical protein B0H19DRAFT_1077342 [Mycena capillaripes]|nr:hypothetical protein B0H19DRAFT_1077342 [Mycena capillaripes]